MIYVIVYGPLQVFFAGLSEREVKFTFEKNAALCWSSREEALRMEDRLNSMFRQETLEFSVMEKDPVTKIGVAIYTSDGQHDAQCTCNLCHNMRCQKKYGLNPGNIGLR